MKSLYRPLRTRQRLSLCGMLFAFVVQILAWSAMPVFAKGVSSDEGWIVICTAEGFVRIPLVEIGIDSAPSHSDKLSLQGLVEHCDLCAFAHGLGLGPSSVVFLEHINAVRVGHVRAPDSVASDKPYTPQQPRAPPLS